MLLAEMICPEAIITDFATVDRDDVIRILVDALSNAGCFAKAHSAEIAADVIKREQAMGTTGLGQGIAIPHARTAALDVPVIAIGIARDGVDFEAMDNQPVSIIFLLASPDKPEQHLGAMDVIIRHLHQPKLRAALRLASNPNEVLELLRQANHHPTN